MDFRIMYRKCFPHFNNVLKSGISYPKSRTMINRTLTSCNSCANKLRQDAVRNSQSFSTLSALYSKQSITSIEPVKNDLQGFHKEIIELLKNDVLPLSETCESYFDGKGKSFRPATVFLMARLCNYHAHDKSKVSVDQRKCAMISEMIHVGSLMHDDVVDASIVRRGKSTVNYLFGDKNAVMAGNFVVSTASLLLSTIDHHGVSKAMSRITKDLVDGEIMQQTDEDHFDHYLKKTYNKTASLFANCCKSVALLSGVDDEMVKNAMQYGVNVGTAFQLVDDILDFVSSADMLGKPAVADLQLGLATAPVLFAREKDRKLEELIRRRFKEPGDVDYALKSVLETDSLTDSRMLALDYCQRAKRNLDSFSDCREKTLLLDLPQYIYERSS